MRAIIYAISIPYRSYSNANISVQLNDLQEFQSLIGLILTELKHEFKSAKSISIPYRSYSNPLLKLYEPFTTAFQSLIGLILTRRSPLCPHSRIDFNPL